jgi:glyoxylate reductase
MSKSTVLITRNIPIELEPLHAITNVEVWPERNPPLYEFLIEKVKTINGLLCLLTDSIDAELIAASPSLQVISQMAVGYNNIDIAAATARKIPIGHTPGVLTNATADLTWALLMAAARRIVEADRFTRSGQWTTWEPELLLGPDVAGATLGIIGLGRIGQAIARRAKGFDMQVLYTGHQRHTPDREAGAEWTSFETLLQTADFVTIGSVLDLLILAFKEPVSHWLRLLPHRYITSPYPRAINPRNLSSLLRSRFCLDETHCHSD